MNHKKIKLSHVLCLLALALILAILVFPLYRKINHFYDQKQDIHAITFHMSQDVPKGSYGHEMRIVNVSINGNKVDLTQFENEDWVWHGEWGYVLYQEGETDFSIKSDDPIDTFIMEYVKQEGSGFCHIECGDNVIDLKMYRNSWKNTFLKVNYQNTLKKILCFVDIYLLSLVFVFLCYRIVFNFNNKDKVVGGIGSSLTMFDFAKGLGMIFIILGHSMEDVTMISGMMSSINSAFFGIIAVFIIYSLMTMFFIASGYGFRKADIRKVSGLQLKYLFSQYWKVAVGVIVVSLFRVFFDGSFSVKDFWFKTLPFPLFSAHDGSIAGIDIGNIGPIWYGLALCIAWIILSLILTIDSQLLQAFCVVICIGISYFLSKFDVYFFCLTLIFAAVPMIYIGYLIRKNRIWTKETGLKRIVYILLAILFCIGAIVNGLPFGMAVNNWGNNQIVGLLVSILGGFLLLRAILILNKPLKGKAKLIKRIGRESYHVFYIHTFEYLAIPWENITREIKIAEGWKIICIFILRSVLIWLILMVVKKIRIKTINGKK